MATAAAGPCWLWRGCFQAPLLPGARSPPSAAFSPRLCTPPSPCCSPGPAGHPHPGQQAGGEQPQRPPAHRRHCRPVHGALGARGCTLGAPPLPPAAGPGRQRCRQGAFLGDEHGLRSALAPGSFLRCQSHTSPAHPLLAAHPLVLQAPPGMATGAGHSNVVPLGAFKAARAAAAAAREATAN